MHRLPDHALGDHGGGRGGGAHDDVDTAEAAGQLLEGQYVAAELLCELLRACDRPVRESDGPGFAAAQGLGRFLRNLAGPDGQHMTFAEVPENLLRERNGHGGHTHLTFADGGFAAHDLGGVQRLLENPVEHRADGSRRLRHGIGRLHLSKNLGFADHLGVEPGGDFKQMDHRVAVGPPERDRGKGLLREVLEAAELGGDMGAGLRIHRGDVDLDAVAGVEHTELGDRAGRAQGCRQRGLFLGGQGEALTPLDRRGVMAGADEEELRRRRGHGARSTAAPAGGGNGRRLALTGHSEAIVAANNTTETMANGRATRRCRKRSTKTVP